MDIAAKNISRFPFTISSRARLYHLLFRMYRRGILNAGMARIYNPHDPVVQDALHDHLEQLWRETFEGQKRTVPHAQKKKEDELWIERRTI